MQGDFIIRLLATMIKKKELICFRALEINISLTAITSKSIEQKK